jgi:hypothetical protein
MDVDISKIKPGDKIAISGQFDISLKEVLKITPTGRVKLTNGDTYDKNGRLMGEHFHYSYIVSMEDYEAEQKRKIEKKEKQEIFNQICLNMNLSIDQLRRILMICKE